MVTKSLICYDNNNSYNFENLNKVNENALNISSRRKRQFK
jgi:hypothetical protein